MFLSGKCNFNHPSLGSIGCSHTARMSSLGPDGKWPSSEVDYTSGCKGRRANWCVYLCCEPYAGMLINISNQASSASLAADW